MPLPGAGWQASSGSRAPRAALVGRPRARRSKSVVHDEGGVVREAPLLVYGGTPRAAGHGGADHLVVDAPADVVGARLAAVRPPRVEVRSRAQLAEGVHVTGRPEQPIHPGTLLGKEAGILLVRPPVPQINGPMRDIPVAAQDAAPAAAAQARQVRREGLQEAVLRGLPLRSRRPRWQVERHHRQVADACLEIASLAIELCLAEAVDHLVDAVARVERHPGVALAVGLAEVALVAGQPGVVSVELSLLTTCLLQADEIRSLAAQPAEQALGRRRAQPTDIDGDDTH